MLTGVVGPSHVITEPSGKVSFETDWTRRFSGEALAVVRPATTEEVVEVVRACLKWRIPIVPQGGNTGLVGGGVPRGNGEQIVLSMARLRLLDPVDEAAQEVTADAGVPLADLQAHVAASGLFLGVDLASRDSATVGGLVATNAGGARAFKFGSVRQQLVGVEAVLGTGAVVSRLANVRKDNTGYHLPSLLAGSEGTLGVVTRARFRLSPAPSHHLVILLGLHSVADAIRSVRLLERASDDIRAAELMLDAGMRLVLAVSSLTPPFGRSYPAYLLIEVAGRTDPTDHLLQAIETCPAADVAVGTDTTTRRGLWELRELHTEAIALRASEIGVVAHKLDVAVPPQRVAEFIEAAIGEVAATVPSAECYIFGHVGDGNLHINLVGDLADPDGIDERILQLTVGYGGSISAEHGIGTSKTRWLGLTRTDDEIQTMRAIKQALDPQGIMNPGVLLPAV